jgi:quinol---cytochrome-c reductase cytochrome c subunit
MRPNDALARGSGWRRWGGVFALGLIGLGAAFSVRGVAQAQGTTGSPVAALEGQRLYLQSCASCHGVRAEGTSIGPPLTNVGTAAWSFQLRTGRMPLSAPGETSLRHEPAFTPQQIDALLAFAATVTQGPQVPQVNVANGNLQQGWQAYVQNCAACHAATGAGDAVGGGFIAPSLLNADPQTVGEAILTGPGAMPAFPFLAGQIDSIAAYVQQLRSPHVSPGGVSLGGLGPVAEGFIAVFVGLGLLLLVVQWIAGGGGATASRPTTSAAVARAPDEPQEPPA